MYYGLRLCWGPVTSLQGEYDIIKKFAFFCQHFVILSARRGEKHEFLLKTA